MDADSFKPGEIVGPYRIVRKIGQGGMGEVFEAFEDSLQRRIAVKVLTREASSQPDLVNRFKVEGRALARLEHGNIVRVYTLDEHDGRVFMAMEYIDGWTLDTYLRTHYFGLDEVLRLSRHLLEGLAAAHNAGIIHRDIKPQNIMVDRRLNTKLLDFGIAKVNEEDGGVDTVTGVMFGTLNYIAPEIFNGASATKRSDIYSLGLVFYLMFSGKSPFTGKSRLEIVEKVTNTKITFPPETNAILPEELKKVIYRMVAKEPHERYQSAREALNALAKVELNALPLDLRPSLSAQMNIECPDELRVKCTQIGLDYFEIRLVICLAAEITLKTQTWSGQQKIVVGPRAMTEAARRYVFAKRQMIIRNAYRNSNFRRAVGGLFAAISLATLSMIFLMNGGKQASQPANQPPPPPVVAAPMQAPAPVPAAASASAPVPVAVKPIEPAKPPVAKTKTEPKPQAKIARIQRPRKKLKVLKKPEAPRAPAAVSSEPAPASEPDFLKQKPVLLPTVIERGAR